MLDAQNRANHPRCTVSGARNPDFVNLGDPLGYDFPVLRSRPLPPWRGIICVRCVIVAITIAIVMTIIAAKCWS